METKCRKDIGRWERDPWSKQRDQMAGQERRIEKEEKGEMKGKGKGRNAKLEIG